jgi:hypothetical protein
MTKDQETSPQRHRVRRVFILLNVPMVRLTKLLHRVRNIFSVFSVPRQSLLHCSTYGRPALIRD